VATQTLFTPPQCPHGFAPGEPMGTLGDGFPTSMVAVVYPPGRARRKTNAEPPDHRHLHHTAYQRPPSSPPKSSPRGLAGPLRQDLPAERGRLTELSVARSRGDLSVHAVRNNEGADEDRRRLEVRAWFSTACAAKGIRNAIKAEFAVKTAADN